MNWIFWKRSSLRAHNLENELRHTFGPQLMERFLEDSVRLLEVMLSKYSVSFSSEADDEFFLNRRD